MLAGSASLRAGDDRLSRSCGSYWARPRGIGSMPPLKAGNAFSSVRDIPLPARGARLRARVLCRARLVPTTPFTPCRWSCFVSAVGHVLGHVH